jgi:hypothetical protein
MAVLYRDWDRVPVKRYDWEEDDSVPDWFPEEFHDSEGRDDAPSSPGDERDPGDRWP